MPAQLMAREIRGANRSLSQAPKTNWLRHPRRMLFVVILAVLPYIAYFNHEHPWILMVLAMFYIATAFFCNRG